jgi:hypothetical protein
MHIPNPTEQKTVQSRILAYAQEIGWTYVPREESERRRRFLPHPNPPQGQAREMMEQQLMTAQLRVYDLDPDEFLQQPVAEIGDGSSPGLQRPN